MRSAIYKGQTGVIKAMYFDADENEFQVKQGYLIYIHIQSYSERPVIKLQLIRDFIISFYNYE